MLLAFSYQAQQEPDWRFVIKMEEDIKNRLVEISKNHNGNHKRTIKDLEEVIDNLKDNQKQKRNADILKAIGLVGIVFAFIFFANAAISYNINGKVELRAVEGEVIVGNHQDSNNTYLNIDETNITLPSTDCDSSEEHGRLILSQAGDSLRKLYVCTDIGWRYVTLK